MGYVGGFTAGGAGYAPSSLPFPATSLLMETCFCLAADSSFSHCPSKGPSPNHEIIHDCSPMACLLPLLGSGLIRMCNTVLANERNWNFSGDWGQGADGASGKQFLTLD